MATLSISTQASSAGVPGIGTDFLVAGLELLSNSSIRVWFTKAPVLGTNRANDAHSYAITGPNSIQISLATAWQGDSRVIDLYLDQDLSVGQWTLAPVSANIISDDVQAVNLPATTYIFTVTNANKAIQNPETDNNLTRKFLNPAFLKDSQTNWRALEYSLEKNRLKLTDIVNKVANQLFISTASGKYLNTRASNVGVTHNPILGLTDEIYRKLTITILNDKLTANAKLDLLEVIYGPEACRAVLTSSNEEPYRLFDQATLNILVDGKTLVPVVFNWSEFNNCLKASAQEVCFVINNHFESFGVKAFAVPFTDTEINKTYIRIFSGTKGLKSSLTIVSGSSQLAFGFDSILIHDLVSTLNPQPSITITPSALDKAIVRVTGQNPVVYQITELTDTVTELAVTDLSSSNKIVSDWQDVGPGRYVSITSVWTGTPTGIIGIEFTNEVSPTISTIGDALPFNTMVPAPVQPSGSAGRMPLVFVSTGQYFRLTYQRTSGTGTLVANVALQASNTTQHIPSLFDVLEWDYVNILGSEYNINNRGSFAIEQVDIGDTYIDFTITNPDAILESVVPLSIDSVTFYRPTTKQVFDNDNYAYISNNLYQYAINLLGYARASIPVNTNIIVRNIENAAYLNSCPESEETSLYRKPDGSITISGTAYPANTIIEIQDFFAKIPTLTDLTSKLFSYTTTDSARQLTLPVLLTDLYNRVILIGGRSLPSTDFSSISVASITESVNADLELTPTLTWTNATAFNSQIYGTGMSAVVLDYPRFYNKVLITGGFTGDGDYNSNKTYLYNPEAYTLTEITGSNPSKHADAALVWCKETNLAVAIGGVDENGDASTSFYTWDPSYNTDEDLGQWHQGNYDELNFARTNCQAIELNNGKVLVVGGRVNNSTNTFTLTNIGTPLNSCELISPSASVTTTPVLTGSMGYSRFAFGMVKLPDSRILVVGGIGGKVSQGITATDSIVNHELNSCEIYDPIGGYWSPIASMKDPHSYCTCYYDSLTNRVYIYGGCSSLHVEYLDLATMTWHYSTATLATPSFRCGSAGVTLNNSSIILRTGSTYTTFEDNSPGALLATYNENARGNAINGMNTLYQSNTHAWTKNQPDTTFYVNTVAAQVYDLGYPEDGPYIFDPGVIYGISGTELTIETEIPRGKGCPPITVTEDLVDLEQQGYLIVDFGYENQVGPVRYFITDPNTISFDPAFNFNKEYYTGTKLTIVAQRVPYTPEGVPNTFWLTASNAGLEAAQKYIRDIHAEGIDLTIDVRYPGDRGLGNEGQPVEHNYKLSDIIEVFGPDDIDTFLDEARNE